MSIQQSLLFAGRMVKKAGFKNKKKPHVLVMRLTRMSCRSTIIKKLMKILYALLCVPSSLLGSFCLLIFLPVFPRLCRLFFRFLFALVRVRESMNFLLILGRHFAFSWKQPAEHNAGRCLRKCENFFVFCKSHAKNVAQEVGSSLFLLVLAKRWFLTEDRYRYCHLSRTAH